MPTVNEILKQKVISYFPSNRRIRISVFRKFFNDLIDGVTNQTILTTGVFLVGPKYKVGSKELLTPSNKQEDFNRWVTDVNLAQHNEIEELKSKLTCVMNNLGMVCSGSGSGDTGIGGGLLEAWANAILLTPTDNNFTCGGSFFAAKIVSFEGSLYLSFMINDISAPYFNVSFYQGVNDLIASTTIQTPTGGTNQVSIPVSIDQNLVTRVEIVAPTYSTTNNSNCTSGSINLIP